MSDYRAIEQKIQNMLGSTRRPIAISFLDAEPEGVTKFAGAMPSSCSFWRIAADGKTFYTVPSDHLNSRSAATPTTACLPTACPNCSRLSA